MNFVVGMFANKLKVSTKNGTMENSAYLNACLFSPSMLKYVALDDSLFEDKKTMLNTFSKMYERLGIRKGLLSKVMSICGKLLKITRTDVFLLVSVFVMHDYFKYPKIRELIEKNTPDSKMLNSIIQKYVTNKTS